MLRKIGIFVLALVCMVMLAACGCEHVWQEATCKAPATCRECGKTEGDLGAHIWNDATCIAPKTCTTCGATEGMKLDHQLRDATCEEADTCEICGYTEGEALGHSWFELTCTTVCERCFAEDPASPGHVLHDATCARPQWCEVCHMEFGKTGDHEWLEADCSNPKRCANCDKFEGTHIGHVLEAGSDGITGTCTVCNKAVEYYYQNTDRLYGWTDYEVASDGSYINPVTYLLSSWKDMTYKSYNWLENGKLEKYEFKTVGERAYYAQGKVYYYTSYHSDNPKAVVNALMNAAKKHISFREATYSNLSYTSAVLNGPGGWLDDTRGYVDGAVDVYGKTFAIVHKVDPNKDDDPTLTWAVACNWMK